MPRAPRLQAPDVVYHVGSRGVDKQPIFDVAKWDRRVFLELLEHVVRAYEWRLFAYCLMGNHFHLVFDTPLANIADGMRVLKGDYAQWFNTWAGREGALFERRYWSTIADDDDDVLRVVRYVALNPVRAGICKTPDAYEWSSYRATTSLAKPHRFLADQELLGRFGEGERARLRYAQFVSDGIGMPAPASMSRRVA